VDLTKLPVDWLEVALKEARAGRQTTIPRAMERSNDVDGIAKRLNALPADARALLLEAVVAERRRTRRAPELVWTGPDVTGSTARDTAIVLRQLFDGAQQEILLAGYAFDHAETILRPLHGAMLRGVAASLFLDVRALWPPERPLTGGVEPAILGKRFLSQHWPFGAPTPRLYGDARALAGDVYSSLHAKCVVVDEGAALISSANFTDRGQSRNVEAGVLVHDASFARQLAGHFRRLTGAGHFVPL
jgi:phosphatidylserine/phosphatidylglycerophosphate/cardiolipin synthase-like enzyme